MLFLLFRDLDPVLLVWFAELAGFDRALHSVRILELIDGQEFNVALLKVVVRNVYGPRIQLFGHWHVSLNVVHEIIPDCSVDREWVLVQFGPKLIEFGAVDICEVSKVDI